MSGQRLIINDCTDNAATQPQSKTRPATNQYGSLTTANQTTNTTATAVDQHASTSYIAACSSDATTANGSEHPSTNDNRPIAADQMLSTLTVCQKIGYGLGHVFNDLCAGVWFSYTLLFMQGCLSIPAEEAGALVMWGQIGDALATPIIGCLTDRYGTKRKWHAAGTALVFVTFPLIFTVCPGCRTAPIWWPPLYFAVVILLFQIGWPIVQISHLSMIPELARTRKDRADLTAIRYSASVCSNVMVYVVTWAVLHAGRHMDDGAGTDGGHSIGPADAYRFRVSFLFVCFLSTFSICDTQRLFFHIPPGHCIDPYDDRHHDDGVLLFFIVFEWWRTAFAKPIEFGWEQQWHYDRRRRRSRNGRMSG